MGEIVERVARALDDAGMAYDPHTKWRFARAAIAAMREPTRAMEVAAYAAEETTDDAGIVWRAMIDAALADG